MISVPARTLVATSAIMDIATIDQTKIGTRPSVIPGARMLMNVARKLTAPRIDEIPTVSSVKM